MPVTMTAEIYWLVLSTVLTAFLFIPYAIVRIGEIGLVRAFTAPLPGDTPFDIAWGHRAYRAHMNGVENLVLFAPLVLAVSITGLSNQTTELASATYFFARLAHAPIYIVNIPILRTVSYLIGLGACLALAYQLLR